jgi:hypothetical protein
MASTNCAFSLASGEAKRTPLAKSYDDISGGVELQRGEAAADADDPAHSGDDDRTLPACRIFLPLHRGDMLGEPAAEPMREIARDDD